MASLCKEADTPILRLEEAQARVHRVREEHGQCQVHSCSVQTVPLYVAALTQSLTTDRRR